MAQQPSAVLAQKSADAPRMLAVAQERGHVRVIVQFASPTAPSAIRSDPASVANIKARVAAAQDTIIARHFGSATTPAPGPDFARGLRRFSITPGFAVNVTQQELEALAADPRVLRIQEDRAVPPLLLQSVPLIGMPNAYTAGATGQGYAVAVLDTGVQANHEFLAGKVVAEACFSNAGGFGGKVSLCPNGTETQTGGGAADPNTAQCINASTNLCRHGTHVAGIAAANNTGQSPGEPSNGVARNGSIFAIQVFTRFNDAFSCSPGSAPCVRSYSSDQIDAMDYVLTNVDLPGGIKVASANLSLGGGLYSGACDGDSLKTPIDNLRAVGVLTAIASGNDDSTSMVSAPGCISTAVTVGSTDKTDVISSFSNMSPVVDLLAPGGFGGGSCAFGANNPDILASVPGASNQTTLYACLAGTSMATPHVAGAIAAIRTSCPTATADEIETALKNTGLSITDTRPGGTVTKPRIRVDQAVTALACPVPVLAVAPATDIVATGAQGGSFTPSSFPYTLSATSGTVGYSISGVPSWLTASSLSGTATTAGTSVTFSVNASANSLAPGTYGPTTITFTNTANGQGDSTRTATLTVYATPTCSLGASPSTINQGQNTTLSWTSTNATSGTINNGVGAATPVASGSRSVSPAQTVTYTGTFTGAGGTTTCQTTVTVIPLPTCTLSASPSTIVQGESSTISWTSQNATGGTIDNIGAVGPSGSAQVLPGQTTTYNGTFTGAGGTGNCSTSVTVTAPPPTVARAHGFRHPLGSGYLTEANDGDGWRVTLDYTCQIVGNTYNLGEDWIKETGDSLVAPVLSIGNGQVTQAVTSASGLGNYVLIKHDLADPEFIRNAWRTSVVSLYAHLEDFSVAVGDIISIGQQIGHLSASSPKLHLEVRLGPQYVNTTGFSAQPDPEGWVDPTRFIDAHRNAHLALVTFNADVKRDVLWRNELGTLAMWLMNGAQIQSGLFVANSPTDRQIAGLGDFNGDGKGDILWRHDDGTVSLWLMNSEQIQSSIVIGMVPTDWHIAGVGDFNGDGKADVLWRQDGGAHAMWLMNGGQIQSGLFLGSVPTDWHIVGIGDFDADGKADVFWRQDTGALAMWLMNGGQVKSGLLLGSVPIDWHAVGIGDFDADGKADVLWRQDGGALAMWLMNGGQIKSGLFVGSVTPDWHIVGIGDLNADGRSDVLWRNDSGAVATWLVNGGNIQTGPVVGNVPNDWNVIPHPGDRVVGAGPPSGC